MNKAIALYKTATGKKFIMAITGLIGFGFVIAHMLGNLQVFAGPEKLNAYGELIKSSMGLLWIARIILIGAVISHILVAFQLTKMSTESRPIKYARWSSQRSTYASRTMKWSGPILSLFIIYHILHFTVGSVHPNFQEGQVYSNVVLGFSVWYVSAFYIIAMLALGLHLYHGAWSLFQSLGINTPKYERIIRDITAFVTILITIGNISIPVSVLLGIIK